MFAKERGYTQAEKLNTGNLKMYRVLIISLLFALLTAGVVEARGVPWGYVLPIDEMTGEKDYRKEKVRTSVDIEDVPWWAGLMLFCKGDLAFAVFENSSLKQVELFQFPSEGKAAVTELRLKFDNNEPILTYWPVSAEAPDSAEIQQFMGAPKWFNNMRKEIIRGMIKHRRLWIEFRVQSLSYIAKFDLTGFSRELAKCSKIPDTN